MWGKGKKLEIHNNQLNRTTIVRITSEYLRNKILEKSIWYVGDTMFHTALWSSTTSAQPPAMDSIKIWAHLTGVPLDLRHREGLSLVAGLVGDPKETDAFTLNLVSLSLSHVKVEVDLTKPLPSVVEFERQSGEVVEVLVSYPWLPPTCSHCKELGHIARNCLKLPVPPAAPPGKGKGSMRKPDKKETKEKSAPQVQYVAVKDHNTKKPLGEAESGSATVNLSSPRTPFSKDSQSIPLPMDTENSFSIPKSTTRKAHHKKPSQTSISSSPNPFAMLNTPQSSPDPPRPSLKRFRSSPTLSPPPPLHQKTLTLPAPSSYPSEITKPATTTRSSGIAGPDSFTPNHTILTSPAPSSSLSETSNLATTTLSSGNLPCPISCPPSVQDGTMLPTTKLMMMEG
ncbi:unnamed protein product [Brassica oleracea var. botrytis]